MANHGQVCPIAKLDDLLRQGKLISSEVMPRFAEELERMTPNVDVDNIETALRRLGNTFQDIVKRLGVGELYKSLIKAFDKFCNM